MKLNLLQSESTSGQDVGFHPREGKDMLMSAQHRRPWQPGRGRQKTILKQRARGSLKSVNADAPTPKCGDLRTGMSVHNSGTS